MSKVILGLAALAMAVPVMAPAVAGKNDRREDYNRYYSQDGVYSGPTWRGDDGRTYCRRRDGTTGLVIGAAAGALVGRAIDRRGDRAAGTIVGAVAGGLIGRQIERSNNNRCE
ncbi:MAG TPA: glycine zipper 2TM domain-containing protein [Allosphingosinicella sp.]|nr:glycine zipper 2TM domain-containing protein [Allosphingosinicella sp.]